MEPKIIKTEAEHKAYLADVERLAMEDPRPGTPEGNRLELLAKLVEDYEKEQIRFERPDPVSAIRFRMEEQGLKQKDLASLLGGKNRASEVLAGKRLLTVAMIRSLSEALRIPSDLLIGEESTPTYVDDMDDSAIPVAQLIKSGWFPPHQATRLSTSAIVAHYLKPAQGPLYLRRTITHGSTPRTNRTKLWMWVARVREIAAGTQRERGLWKPETFSEEFLSYVARLSWSEQGPRRAKEFLAEKGIALILHPSIPGTKLDGAAMRDQEGAPIIGLTARFDRLDNFWFTLMHELVHAWKHLPEWDIAITDENLEEGTEDDAKEVEANRLARDLLIPRALWKRSEAYLRPSEQTVVAFADRIHISPAIVAGRLRREKTGYASLARMVGNKQVRRQFPEVRWT